LKINFQAGKEKGNLENGGEKYEKRDGNYGKKNGRHVNGGPKFR